MAHAVKPEAEFPPGFFRRIDESSDLDFYREPRLVTHLDDATLEALTAAYHELVPAGVRVLDLMSSWVSHLPPEVEYAHVSVGMNEAELRHNPRLHAYIVRDLNTDPTLPFSDESFDAVWFARGGYGSCRVAEAVIRQAVADGVARNRPDDPRAAVAAVMWEPNYPGIDAV